MDGFTLRMLRLAAADATSLEDIKRIIEDLITVLLDEQDEPQDN